MVILHDVQAAELSSYTPRLKFIRSYADQEWKENLFDSMIPGLPVQVISSGKRISNKSVKTVIIKKTQRGGQTTEIPRHPH